MYHETCFYFRKNFVIKEFINDDVFQNKNIIIFYIARQYKKIFYSSVYLEFKKSKKKRYVNLVDRVSGKCERCLL